MKKKLLMLLFVCMTMSVTAFAQKDAKDNILWDVELGLGTKYKGLQQANLSLDLGYRIADFVYPYFRTRETERRPMATLGTSVVVQGLSFTKATSKVKTPSHWNSQGMSLPA